MSRAVRRLPIHLDPISRAVIAMVAVATAVSSLTAIGLAASPGAAGAATTSYGMWGPSVVPSNPTDPDTAKVNVGVRFTSSVDGYVNAVQFYRSSANAGPHTGQLWTAGGRLLAQVSFPSTTATGWLTARFSSRVKLTAGRSYVASYVAPRGRYAADNDSLSPTRPVVRGALTAKQGVYTYGTGVPSQSWRDTNYYVDVVFTPGSTTSPTPSPTPTPPPAGTCTDGSAVYVWDEQQGTAGPAGPLGDYYAASNVWNWSQAAGLEQHMAVCSRSSWYVTDVVPTNLDQTSVKTYPNIHKDFHDWGTGAEPRIDSFTSIAGTYAGHATDVGIYNVAWDIWINGVGHGANEVMVWTQNRNQRPAGDKVATATIAGAAWDVWATNDNKYIAFVPPNGASRKSGSLNFKALFTYLIEAGRLPASSTLGQIGYGIEVCSTEGKTLRFDVNDFSVTTS